MCRKLMQYPVYHHEVLTNFVTHEGSMPAANGMEKFSHVEKFAYLRSAMGTAQASQECPRAQLPHRPQTLRAPQTHHRSRCIVCNFSGSFGGNMVGRIWVCLLWGTSSHSANHCPSFVITCKTRGNDSKSLVLPNRKITRGQYTCSQTWQTAILISLQS